MTVETQVDREVDWQNFEDSAMVEVEHRNFLAVVNAKKSLDGFSIPSYNLSESRSESYDPTILRSIRVQSIWIV
ncbi:hypothetical protein CsSME_00025403 [Camellia sinensis var. sinensis]